MRKHKSNAIAAAVMVATIVVSSMFVSCEGRKMSNMKPTGETVEVVINEADTSSAPVADSSQMP